MGMIMRAVTTRILVFLGALALPGLTVAQSVRLLGDFRDWSAYAAPEGAGAQCFTITRPTEVTPIPEGYTQAYLYVTHRPAEGVRDELSLVAGFTFAPDTPATLSVGAESFQLFTENDAAWLLDPSQGATLAGVMRAGSTLIVEGTSDKGFKIRETFSLSGATAASKAIGEEC